MKTILCIMLLGLILVGTSIAQPGFENYGSVRGQGYGEVYQSNPYQGTYYNYWGYPYYFNYYWYGYNNQYWWWNW